MIHSAYELAFTLYFSGEDRCRDPWHSINVCLPGVSKPQMEELLQALANTSTSVPSIPMIACYMVNTSDICRYYFFLFIHR